MGRSHRIDKRPSVSNLPGGRQSARCRCTHRPLVRNGEAATVEKSTHLLPSKMRAASSLIGVAEVFSGVLACERPERGAFGRSAVPRTFILARTTDFRTRDRKRCPSGRNLCHIWTVGRIFKLSDLQRQIDPIASRFLVDFFKLTILQCQQRACCLANVGA
jgi:hypothetical protein